MNSIQAVVLGLIQGLTEFLPISSSGHLVIGQKLFGFDQPPILFDILVHLGTLFSVLLFFKDKLLKISLKIFWLIIIASIPAGLVGLFLNQYILVIFNSLNLVAVALLITAGLLFSIKLIKKPIKGLEQLNFKDAFIIGCFQALAILPGISRSGSTLTAALWRGLKQETAFNFSFLLAIPAMIGALTFQIPGIDNKGDQLITGLVGMLMAAISGFLSLKILKKVILKGKLFYFGIYCLLLGIAILSRF